MMKIYTDGAYSNSRSIGGYSFVVSKLDGNQEEFTSVYFKKVIGGTNQTAEMLAMIAAFRYLLNLEEIPEVEIVTDSMYVLGTLTKNWRVNANHELWAECLHLYSLVKDKVTMTHVRGHQGIPGNELADKYAVLACDSYDGC